MVEVPVQETTKKRALSDEVSEDLKAKTAQTMARKGIMCYKDEEEQKQLKNGKK
jgi:hypothetical protein